MIEKFSTSPSLFWVRLQRIGLTPALMQDVLKLSRGCAEPLPTRVVEVQRAGVLLHDGQVERPARLLPALRKELADQADAIAVGDWVVAECNALGECWVVLRLAPTRQLARRLHDGRDKVTRVVIASHVDTALLVMGLDHDFNLRRLERYVALVRMAGVDAVVVLTKKDLCPDAAERLREVQAAMPADLPAVAVDARGGDPAVVLAPWLLTGLTLVLLGSSGAGKSTLTNALTGRDTQDTGANRDGDSRGRHTTTARSLHVTPQGACIIDTPGLRTLRLDGSAEGLDTAFSDVAQLALRCRFRDCRHADEPGCAVRDGVSAERLRNHGKLQREARRDTVTALERKAQVQTWKVRARARHARDRGDSQPE
jgi:ribosome biogenesis GTPase